MSTPSRLPAPSPATEILPPPPTPEDIERNHKTEEAGTHVALTGLVQPGLTGLWSNAVVVEIPFLSPAYFSRAVSFWTGKHRIQTMRHLRIKVQPGATGGERLELLVKEGVKELKRANADLSSGSVRLGAAEGGIEGERRLAKTIAHALESAGLLVVPW